MSAALSVALLLWAPQAHAASAAASVAAQRQGAANQVLVWATSGGGRRLARPHHALVRVRSHGRVIGRGRTGVRGIAVVTLKRAPRQFSVQVSGGVFRGQRPKHVGGSLRTRVSGYRGGPVYVNPATTLLYYYAALHPKRSLRKDGKRVAAFLRLPPGHDLEGDMISSAAFNGRRYMRRARRRGGLDVYSRALARRVDAKRARASAIESPSALGTLASLSNSLNAYSGIFRAISSVSGALSIVNTTMTLAGVSPLNNQLSELSEQMGQLLQEMQVVMNDLGALSTQVEKLSLQDAKSTFATLKGQQGHLMGHIEEAAEHYVTIANLGAQISCPNGTANCPEAEPVKKVCAAAKEQVKAAKAAKEANEGKEHELGEKTKEEREVKEGEATENNCVKLKALYTGTDDFLEIMKNHGLSDFSEARSLAAAIGPNGLIDYASLATAAGQRFYTSEQSAAAVASADYYVSQLSLLITLIGAYETAPTIEASVESWEPELEKVTEKARELPGQVPSVLPSANVIDTSTGLMWQAQLAPNAVISSSGYGLCPENEPITGPIPGVELPAVCDPYQYPGLTALYGATPWEVANAGTFRYVPPHAASHASAPALWESASRVLFSTVGEDAPANLAGNDWKAAPQTALEGLIAGTSYAAMVEAGFSPKLFEVEEFADTQNATVVGGGNTGVAVVLTLPGNGAPDEFHFPNWAGFFNFEKAGTGVGLFEPEGRLREISANYLMERTPAASECWYYASPEQHPSCP